MAAGDTSQKFGTSSSMTITLASLASSSTAGRESTSVDLSSTVALDVLVQVKVTTGSGTPANDQAIYVYVYGSEDGTKYTSPATGSDAAITVGNNLRIAQVIAATVASTTYIGSPFSLAACFGGVLPRKFGVAIRNYEGQTLSSTAADHAVTYSAIYANTASS